MRSLALLLLIAAAATADTVHLRNGKKIEGRIVSESAEQVVISEYNSPLAGATFGQQTIAMEKVKAVLRTSPAPALEFQLRLRSADSAEGCLELAAWCETQKLKEERLVACEKALRLDASCEEARKALGAKAPKGEWSAQLELARRFVLGEEDRDDLLAEMKRDAAFPWSERELWRAVRSAQQAKGYQRDRPLALRADLLLPNARYALYVPDSYDPLLPTPLVVGLHGGGAGGADGKLVVGSGDQAMPFYQGECEKRGWICVCPNALRAGWQARENDDLIDAMLEELRALFNIDEHRTYLVGHSMGGGGTWAQGTRIPETWAAIAPAASFGVQGLDKLRKTKTGFYVYHSDNDSRCACGPVRSQMISLPGSDADFVYSEIPGRDHDFPREVITDIFAFFDARLLATGRGRLKPETRPLSSFLRKESRDEKKYLPTLGEQEEDAGGAGLKALLRELRTGGGVSEASVEKLARLEDPKTSSQVAKVMLRPNTSSDIRRYAARILGARKASEEIDSLGRILLIEPEAEMLLEAVHALEAIADPAAGDALLRFLRKRKEFLDQRCQGSQVDHSDWVTILPPMTAACSLLGSFGTPKAAPLIAEVVLDGIVLSKVEVVFDTKNQNPLPAARALAAAACGALARLADPSALAVIERLVREAGSGAGTTLRTLNRAVGVMSEWPKDPAILGAATEARDTLSQG